MSTPATPNLDDIIECARQDFFTRVDGQNIKTAKRADELAADLAGKHAEQYGFEEESEEREAILTALFTAAGETFPGGWEDYPAN
ncbi:MAG TPA: hypothetical protein VGB98_20200 [Pyrinomonadaceae bacterium]|jgi:hypothetical protein